MKVYVLNKEALDVYDHKGYRERVFNKQFISIHRTMISAMHAIRQMELSDSVLYMLTPATYLDVLDPKEDPDPRIPVEILRTEIESTKNYSKAQEKTVTEVYALYYQSRCLYNTISGYRQSIYNEELVGLYITEDEAVQKALELNLQLDTKTYNVNNTTSIVQDSIKALIKRVQIKE